MKLQISGQIFEKHSNIKFHENLSSEIRVVPRGRAVGGRADGRKKTHRQTGMMKLIVAFRSFANAPKNYAHSDRSYSTKI